MSNNSDVQEHKLYGWNINNGNKQAKKKQQQRLREDKKKKKKKLSNYTDGGVC